MKLEKFMCDVTKTLIKGTSKHIATPVLFGKYGDNSVISFNRYFAMIIPESQNIFKHDINWNNVLIDACYEKYTLRPTNKAEYQGKDTIRIFNAYDDANSSNALQETKLLEKFTKYFDTDAFFYQREPKHVVYVVEHDKLCGFIMPIVSYKK